ncbi:MAG: two-component sensor histidine kinase [Desulfovibrionales bacterium]|nr:two-component sensor histidine kinase [Desulfovibrionales bacterium]
MKLNPFRVDPAHPFQLAKFLSISSLVLILGSGLLLSVFITNHAKTALLKKNREFALLLAENLNHQIYRRFTLPVVLGFGKVELKRSDQYERLDQVVDSTVHSFHVLDVRVYNTDGEVVFDTTPEFVGHTDLGGEAVQRAVSQGEHSFVLENHLQLWETLFSLHLEPGNVLLRTVYPLRAERDLNFRDQPGPLLGVLELSQDITTDYATIVQFQRLILAIMLLGSAALYVLIFSLIRKADRVLAERVRDKERLERELVQNEKLASMGRMVASIAHEIRNPLGIIQSSAELLYKKEQTKGGSTARILEAIFQESKRLSQTVNDFLDYARPRQPALEEVNLYKVIQHAVTFLTQEGQEHEVQVLNELPEGFIVQGDRDLLYRGFYNIISNAIQACAAHGQVRILRGCHEQHKVVLIRDSGPGFDATLVDRYMEPFFTTKEQGTGLGLAITRSIFQSHGADMLLRNVPQGGGEVAIIFSEPCE